VFEKLWDIQNAVGNDIAGVILAIIVCALLAVLMFTIGIILPMVGFLCAGLKYQEVMGDYITLAFQLIILAAVVWFADYFSFIKCTMLTIWLWVNVSYAIIRIVVYLKQKYY